MGKPTKAQISYQVGTGDDAVTSTLRFHSVIAEEHEASNEITKFPVQAGFNVSNHKIRKNRKISISGVVTNHLIVGAEEFHEYGGNNVRLAFGALKELVQAGVPCEVATNIDTYTPVIFNRLKTKQAAGSTDILQFTISGEEIQLGLADNATTPTLLVFTPLTDEQREARVAELLTAGIDVPPEAVIAEAPVDFNESFQVETRGPNGETSITTYEKGSYDPTTKTYNHMVHTSDTNVVTSAPTTSFNWFLMMQEEINPAALPNVDLEAGASTASACLVDGLIGIGTDIANEYIDTAVGELKQTIYGAAYGLFGVNGDQGIGQVLLGLGVDCLIAGAVGSVDPNLNPDDFNDNSIPTTDQVLEGAASIGDSVATDTLGVAAPTTLTKIASPTGDTSFFGDLL